MFGREMLSLEVGGEYIAKIYLETKRRPRYVIEGMVRAERHEGAASRVCDETH
jgi:hypothetical protein